MLYTIPDYYKDFSCTADRCEDTCCAGWQIVIDEKSLRKYDKLKGGNGRKVHACIDHREKVFRQDEEKRCAFLDENNLCRMYLMLGKKSLCKTCTLYPRHIEEFEGVREISLSLSCPEVARLLVGRQDPVHFLSYEKPGEDSYEDFDPLLYSQLVEVREQVLHILQDRSLEIDLRIALALAIAHDMQCHVSKRQLFSCAEIPRKYQTESAKAYVSKVLQEFKENDEACYQFAEREFLHLHQLELLNKTWQYRLLETESLLYHGEYSIYQVLSREFLDYMKSQMVDTFSMDVAASSFKTADIPGTGKQGESSEREYLPDPDVLKEQLMVYFVFTYFCGAVYDGRIYAKMQMSAYAVFAIWELLKARWLKNERHLDIEDIVETIYRFSREIEHSDQNLETLEKLMEGDRWICVRKQ